MHVTALDSPELLCEDLSPATLAVQRVIHSLSVGANGLHRSKGTDGGRHDDAEMLIKEWFVAMQNMPI